jgi:hypothetical protein
MFMLDLLDHLPRLRLSDDHLRAVIWIMRECGTPDVPTFSALRKMQSKLDSEVGLASQHHTSSLGNHFYMNHPAKLLALVSMDFRNLDSKRLTLKAERTGQTQWFERR